MTASPDEPAPTADETPAAPSPAGTALPRRTRRTSAIADASATTSRNPPDWTGGDAPTLRARQAAALPERPEGAAEPESSYADGFAAGLAFASRTAPVPAHDEEHLPATAAGTGPQAPAAAEPAPSRARRGWSRPLLLVGAGLAVGVLVCVPFLVRGSGEEDRGPAAATLADEDPAGEAPEAGPAGASPSDGRSPSPGDTGRRSPEAGSRGGSTATPSATGGKATADATGGGAAQQPTAGPSRSAAGSGTAIRSHDSGRCIDGSPPWGSPLQIWDCTGSAAQSWQVKPDGSIRSRGKCMDVAGGSRDDGAAVQLVDCNGTGAQQFRLNAAHDLVNVQADKCVEAEDSPGVNGTRLRLWSCTGADDQKWSRG